MAFLDEKHVLKLPVETKSGAALGRIAGFDVDCETQAILRWRVRPVGLASRVLKTPLLIAREQVIEITLEKMVVEDNIEREMELAKAKEIGLVSHAKA